MFYNWKSINPKSQIPDLLQTLGHFCTCVVVVHALLVVEKMSEQNKRFEKKKLKISDWFFIPQQEKNQQNEGAVTQNIVASKV